MSAPSQNSLKAKLRSLLVRVVNSSSGVRKAVTLDEKNYRRVLANTYLRGEGIEVGALHKPLPIPTCDRVRYVDRMSVAELRRQYPELAGKPLVEPDIIDDGEALTRLPEESQDFVVANHMLEHTEDPIATLKSWARVLREEGVLFIAVPDKRHTFDKERTITPFSHLATDHEQGPSQSRAEHFREWVEIVNGQSGEDAAREMERLMEINYSIHYHVWDSAAFQEFLLAAISKYRLPLEIRALVQTGNEIIAVLEKRDTATAATPPA